MVGFKSTIKIRPQTLTPSFKNNASNIYFIVRSSISAELPPGNFTFEVSADGADCLMVGLGKFQYQFYFLNILVVMILALTFFALSLRVAYIRYRRFRLKSARSTQFSLKGETSVVVDSSRQVLRATMKLSLTAFVYILAIFPLFVLSFYQFQHGNINNPSIRSFFNYYPYICTSIIGVMNSLSYCCLNSVFRKEVFDMFKRVRLDCCRRPKTDQQFWMTMSKRSDTMGTPYIFDPKADEIFQKTAISSTSMMK